MTVRALTSPCLAASAKHFFVHVSISRKRPWYCCGSSFKLSACALSTNEEGRMVSSQSKMIMALLFEGRDMIPNYCRSYLLWLFSLSSPSEGRVEVSLPLPFDRRLLRYFLNWICETSSRQRDGFILEAERLSVRPWERRSFPPTAEIPPRIVSISRYGDNPRKYVSHFWKIEKVI